MSRSTPLTNLPNQNKESSNAYDQNENALVKEILQEIDTDKNQASQQKIGPSYFDRALILCLMIKIDKKKL